MKVKSLISSVLSATIVLTSITPASYADNLSKKQSYKGKIQISDNIDIKGKSILTPDVQLSYDEKTDKTTYEVSFDNLKRYKIKGSIKNYSNQDEESMANGALNPDISVIYNKDENKTIYELKFKPIDITIGGRKTTDEIQELYVFATDNKSEKTKIDSKAINEGDYNQKFVFERQGDIENKITLGFKVQAMGAKISSAVLDLDLDNKEENEEKNNDNLDMDVIAGESKKYSIQGSIKDFSNQTQDSMANRGLNPKVIASYDKENDKSIYTLRFKPIDMVINGQRLTDGIEEFYVFDVANSKEGRKIEGKKINEDGYDKEFTFERQGGIESKIVIGVKVQAMGNKLRKALLVLDFNTKQEIETIIEEDDSHKVALEKDQTLKYKSGERVGENFVLTFENTLPKDYQVELKSVSYGIYNEAGQKERNKVQGATLSQDATTLTVPANIKSGHYYVNIVDAGNKYQSPKPIFESSENLTVLKYGKTPIYPYFTIASKNDWDFHNAKIVVLDGANLKDIVDKLNNNVREIELATLGYTLKEEFYPNNKSGVVKYSNGSNKLFNKDGSLNLDYTAGTAAKDEENENIAVFKNLDRFKTNDKNTTLRWVRIKFWGTEKYISLDLDEPLKPPKEDSNYVKINGNGSNGYDIFLKLKFEDDKLTIKELLDDNTTSRTGGANASVWNSLINSGGLDKYKGKRLEDIKEMNMTSGVDAITGATMSSIDVQNIVIAFLERYYKENNITAGVNKRELIDLLEEGKDIIEGISADEYQSGADEYKNAYQEGQNVKENQSATKKQVTDIIARLKAARQNLALKEVNKEELKNLIADADKKDKNLYDIETLPVFEKALKEAKEIEKNPQIRQIHINSTKLKLENAMNALVEKDNQTAKTYMISGRIIAADGSGDSMASPALNPEVIIREENGKTRFYLRFKAINVQGAQAEIEDLKHIEDKEEKDTRNSQIEGEYGRLFVFERNKQREERFNIKLGARMGSPKLSYPEATLILDYSSIKTNEDIKEPGLTDEEIKKRENRHREDLRDKLKDLMDVREEVYNGDYQDESGNEFKEVYNQALVLYRDANLPDDDDKLDKAYSKLNGSWYNLRLKNKPNTEKLDEIILRSEKILENKDKYENNEEFVSFEKYYKGIQSSSNIYLYGERELYFGAKKLKESSELYIVRQALINKYIEALNEKINVLKLKKQNAGSTTSTQLTVTGAIDKKETANSTGFRFIAARASYKLSSQRFSSNNAKESISRFWHIENGQEKEAQLIKSNGKNRFVFTQEGKPQANLYVKIHLANENKTLNAEMTIEGLEEIKQPIEIYDEETKETGIEINQNIKDALEEGVKIQAKAVKESDKEYKKIQEKAANLLEKITKGEIKLDNKTKEKLKDTKVKQMAAFEINLKKDGQKAQVKEGKTVKLSIPIPQNFDKAKLVAMHLKDNGEMEIIKGRVVGNIYQMEVSSFSHYLLAELEKTSNSNNINENRYTKVKIFIRNSSDDNQLSMSDSAVRREMDVEEKNGKAIYKIYFKPLELEFGGQRLTGNITNFYVYGDGGKEEIYQSSTDGEYSVYEFTRNKLREEQIRIAVTVDAMMQINPKAATKDAIIELDWDNSKVVPSGGGSVLSYLDAIEYYDEASKDTGIKIRPKTKDSLDEKVKLQVKEVKETDKNYKEIQDKITNHLEKITKGDINLDKEIQEKLKNTKLIKFTAFEINLKKDGEKAKVKEDKTVELSIPVPKDYDKEKLVAMHLKDNGEMEVIKGKIVGENYEMEVSDFSHYILAQIEKQEIEKEDNKKLSSKTGYITGYKDGRFKPNANITRGELAFIIAKLIGDEKLTGSINFKDVDKNSWNADAISKLATLGIISGYEDNTFKPSKEVTRAEYASIIARYKTISSDKNEFTDTHGHWAVKAINACKENGYITGYKNGSFKPQNNLTRAEAVVITNKVFDIKASEEVQKQIVAKEMPFTDVKPTDWFYKEVMIAK